MENTSAVCGNLLIFPVASQDRVMEQCYLFCNQFLHRRISILKAPGTTCKKGQNPAFQKVLVGICLEVSIN